ncbi:hypothetical protein BH09BAC3_BH09BAC3_07200 [soil metagenome]
MKFEEGKLYHIYNRGNNRQPIFFKRANYQYFMKKVQKYVSSCSDLLCWTLMPNHFHFLIHANSDTCKIVRESPIPINALTENIRVLLSSYTLAIQKQEKIVGNLFQQKTKSKCVNLDDSNYSTTAFHYIHKNPYNAGLIRRMEDWEFSSFREYLKYGPDEIVNVPDGEFSMDNLCNRKLAYKLLQLTPDSISREAYMHVPDDVLKFLL